MDRETLLAADKPALVELVLQQQQVISGLNARVSELEAQLAKLAAPPKTPGNSSVPPSQARKPNRAPRRGKKRGPKRGHAGTSRPRAVPAATIGCRPTTCGGCGAQLPPEGQRRIGRSQIEELPVVRTVVLEVLRYQAACANCGTRTAAEPPAWFAPHATFGPRVEALLAYLHATHHVSYERLVERCRDVLGLQLSAGAIANALGRVATRAGPAVERISEQVRSSAVINSDETGARVAGDNRCHWVFQTPTASYHLIADTTGAAVIAEFLGDQQPAVWGSDAAPAQLGPGGAAPPLSGAPPARPDLRDRGGQPARQLVGAAAAPPLRPSAAAASGTPGLVDGELCRASRQGGPGSRAADLRAASGQRGSLAAPAAVSQTLGNPLRVPRAGGSGADQHQLGAGSAPRGHAPEDDRRLPLRGRRCLGWHLRDGADHRPEEQTQPIRDPLPHHRPVTSGRCSPGDVSSNRTGEVPTALPRLRSIGPGMLLLWDRGFPSDEMVRATRQRQAHFLGRTKRNIVLRPTEILPDGAFLAQIYPAPTARRRDGRRLSCASSSTLWTRRLDPARSRTDCSRRWWMSPPSPLSCWPRPTMNAGSSRPRWTKCKCTSGLTRVRSAASSRVRSCKKSPGSCSRISRFAPCCTRPPCATGSTRPASASPARCGSSAAPFRGLSARRRSGSPLLRRPADRHRQRATAAPPPAPQSPSPQAQDEQLPAQTPSHDWLRYGSAAAR